VRYKSTVVDTRSPEQRRRIMAAVRSSNTGPELRLRRALYAAGVRGWRCHYKGAPGRPDLAWPALRVAVFVDGAFWHGHPSRHKQGRSGAYWDEKIARNVERDRQVDAALASLGWTVVRMWDFELARDPEGAVERVSGALRERADESVRWQRQLVSRAARTADASVEAESEPREPFGLRLRRARLRAGFSRAELAAAVGLEESLLRLYERGAREPRSGTAVKLERAVGL
jgi:DNA mismatch endonuclease, patch repair protein